MALDELSRTRMHSCRAQDSAQRVQETMRYDSLSYVKDNIHASQAPVHLVVFRLKCVLFLGSCNQMLSRGL